MKEQHAREHFLNAFEHQHHTETTSSSVWLSHNLREKTEAKLQKSKTNAKHSRYIGSDKVEPSC